MKSLTIVPVSTGDEALLTLASVRALETAERRLLRTERHAVAKYLQSRALPYETLDALYDRYEDFDELNAAIVQQVLNAAQDATVAYIVIDAQTDATVEALLTKTDATVIPSVSHADRCFALLRQQTEGVRCFAAEAFRLRGRVTPSEPLYLGELHSRECAGDCKLKLMSLLPDETEVAFFTGDIDGALTLRTVALCELDRQPAYDHLTACFVPPVAMLERTRFDMDDLCEVMRRLRAPGGCPWDREQTHESLLTSLLEESYEFIGAVRDGDIDHMYDELGDVLLQVVFHAEVARQHGDFDINDVTTAITHKMIERHTHIFGADKADTADQVVDNWDALKRKQRGIQTVAEAMEDVSTGLSATMRAAKIQHKAHKVGFDFDDAAAALGKVHEEADEVADELVNHRDPEEELGDVLFAIVNVCRLCGVNPDIALHFATEKFLRRFKSMEFAINKAGKSIQHLTLSEMDVYWEAEKQAESRL